MTVAPYGSFPIGHPLKPIDPAVGISGDLSNAPHHPEPPLRPRAFSQTKDLKLYLCRPERSTPEKQAKISLSVFDI